METSSFRFGIHLVPSSFSPPGLVRPVNNHHGKVSTPFLSSSFLFSPCPPSPYHADKMELPTALVLPSPLRPPRTPKLHPPVSLLEPPSIAPSLMRRSFHSLRSKSLPRPSDNSHNTGEFRYEKRISAREWFQIRANDSISSQQ